VKRSCCTIRWRSQKPRRAKLRSESQFGLWQARRLIVFSATMRAWADGTPYGHLRPMSSPSVRRREAAAAATAVVCAGLATYFVAGNGVSLALMAAAAAYAYSLLGLGEISRERAIGLIGGAAAVGLGRILVATLRPFLDPSTWGTWDFLCFYLDGSVAIRGLNVYDPANYELVFNQLSLPFEPGSGLVAAF
jgi:hypothetical protein